MFALLLSAYKIGAQSKFYLALNAGVPSNCFYCCGDQLNFSGEFPVVDILRIFYDISVLCC